MQSKITPKEEKTTINGFTIAMIVMAIGFFFAFIGFAAYVPAIGVFGLLTGIIALGVGLAIKLLKIDAIKKLFD